MRKNYHMFFCLTFTIHNHGSLDYIQFGHGNLKFWFELLCSWVLGVLLAGK